MKYEQRRARYKELISIYRVANSISALTPKKAQCLGIADLVQAIDDAVDNFDVVVLWAGDDAYSSRYNVIKNGPGLSNLDLAILCDRGRLYAGYSVRRNTVHIYSPILTKDVIK